METSKSQCRPTHIGFKQTMLGKANGRKWGTIGNMLGNSLGTWENHWGTHWELGEDVKNPLGTWREHIENKKKFPKPKPPPSFKGDLGLLGAHWPTSLGAHNFYAYLLFCQFWPRLKARGINYRTYLVTW